MKPILFVTGHAPADRVGAFAALHERETIEVVLFGGRSLHGPPLTPSSEQIDAPARRAPQAGAPQADSPQTYMPRTDSTQADAPLTGAPQADATRTELPFPHRHVHQRETGRLARSGNYRAVVCSTGGRVALPATWWGARRGGVPLILWASLWAHPRSAPHLFSYPALRVLYRTADAVVTYGPHVSAYVRARGAHNVHVAPQAVDNTFWSAPVSARPTDPAWPEEKILKFMFAGRPNREKGVGTLIEAWQRSGLHASSAALVLVGVGSIPPWIPPGGAVDPQNLPAGVRSIQPVVPERLREMYADADVLVVPSIRTWTFREPWGLVVNEAMNRGLATICSDAVGAVAGGLVRNEHNGLVVPAGDSEALASAMARLAAAPELRARLGAAGAVDVKGYTHEAWAAGFSAALASVGLSRTRC